MEDTYLSALIIDSSLIESRFEMIARSGPIIRLFKLSLEFQSLIQMDTGHMVPKALVGLAVVTIKTDGWVFTFRL